MKTILRIMGVDKKLSKAGKTYYITHVVLSDGMEAEGWGKDFTEGQKVTAFYDPEYDKIKIFVS